MAMDDNVEIHAAKKMKLHDEKIPNTEDGTNTVNFEDPQPTQEYFVLVAFEIVSQLHSSREDPSCLFRRILKDVGCSSETLISDYACTSYCFYAELTADQAKKLSDLDSVRDVKPYNSVPFSCRRQIYIRERSLVCEI